MHRVSFISIYVNKTLKNKKKREWQRIKKRHINNRKKYKFCAMSNINVKSADNLKKVSLKVQFLHIPVMICEKRNVGPADLE